MQKPKVLFSKKGPGVQLKLAVKLTWHFYFSVCQDEEVSELYSNWSWDRVCLGLCIEAQRNSIFVATGLVYENKEFEEAFTEIIKAGSSFVYELIEATDRLTGH